MAVRKKMCIGKGVGVGGVGGLRGREGIMSFARLSLILA